MKTLRFGRGIFYGWRVVIACALINFYLGGVFFYGFTAFFNPIVEEFGWTYAAVSFAFSIRGFEAGILAPVLGIFVDRFGPRRLLLFGVIVVGLAFLLLSHIQSLKGFYITFAILAIGSSAASGVVTMTAVARWFRRKIGRAMGLMTVGYGLSGVLVPGIVWLITQFGWRHTLVILGGGMLVIGIPLSLVVRDRPERYGYLPDGDMPSSSVAIEAIEERGLVAKEALKTRNLWLLFLTVAFAGMAGIAVIVHQIPYLTSLGISREVASLTVIALTSASIIGRLGFGWLGDIFDKRYSFAIAVAILALGVFTFAQVQTIWQTVASLVIIGIGFGGAIPLRPALQMELFGMKAFGSIQGIIMIALTIGSVAAPVYVGRVFDTTGSYSSAWFVLAIITLMAIPTVLLIKPVKQDIE